MALGVGLAIPWIRKGTAKYIVKRTQFAFVANPSGAAIYKTPGNDLIDRLDENTYVGVLTGQVKDNYLEVATEVEGSGEVVHFWIDGGNVSIANGQDAAALFMNNGGLEKPQVVINKIVAANA